MCGIAGLLGPAGCALVASARPMIEELKHRGPNGVRTEEGDGWSLAHARLSIIDLEGGWQPLHGAGSTIIGNGEIYNYIELTEEFALKDKLATGSDFEPILHLYALEGEKAFQRLRGMYAFCLIGADGRTWLVRDPFGIKPLSLVRDGQTLAFASEPRALLAHAHIARAAQPAALEDLLALGYVAPGTVEPTTAWRGIEALQPGEIAQVIDGDREETFRSPIPPAPAPVRDEEDALARLDAVLENSVSVHQRSDVPYGLFLSGGVDSTAIATLMARLNQRPVTAFTCGFDAPGARDERGQAETVARALNLDWRETTFGEEDFWRIAPSGRLGLRRAHRRLRHPAHIQAGRGRQGHPDRGPQRRGRRRAVRRLWPLSPRPAPGLAGRPSGRAPGRFALPEGRRPAPPSPAGAPPPRPRCPRA